MMMDEAADLEAKYVHDVYSQIARHFSDTRYKPWPRIAQFLLTLPPGCLVADIGCGNGKYFPVVGDGFMMGCDMCWELVDIAAARGYEVTVADCLNLPYRDNVFDAVISIAVVHHLSSRARRIQAIRELVRVVRGGGQILVYVWAMEQERKKFSEQDVMVPWHLQPKYTFKKEHVRDKGRKRENKKQRTARKKSQKNSKTIAEGTVSRCSGESGDVWGLGELCLLDSEEEIVSGVTESGDPQGATTTGGREHSGDSEELSHDDTAAKDDVIASHVTSKTDHMSSPPSLEAQGFQTFHRFYHVFQKDELSTLFNEVGGVRVVNEFYDHENWCVVGEKVT